MQWSKIARQMGAYLQHNLSFIWQQRLHPAGLPHVLAAAAGTVLFSLLQSSLAFWFGWLAVISFWLFREPKRQVPNIPGVLVSPVDGEVLKVSKGTLPTISGLAQAPWQEYHCVEIYSRLFHPHSLRSPISGTIAALDYQTGQWLAEWQKNDDGETPLTERGLLIISQGSQQIAIEHVGGIIPARIDLDTQAGDLLLQSQRYGASHFGGLMRLYIPLSFALSVYENQNVQGGETILALLPKMN